jgi:hypothetical protein
MADKNINFNIKVNNKELDLTKVSFKQFNEIIKQAKKDLQALPLTDPRYKQLTTDINAAEKAWKEARKSSAEFGDEQEKGGEKVKNYRVQIREATQELLNLEQQFGRNSDQYREQAQVVADLREEQENLVRNTQQLDDVLSQIPGPIGQVATSFKAVEDVGKNAGTALKQLGLGFSSFDKIIKTSLVGFLVGLLVTLVGAVMDAAKAFKPLQDAFARMGDAVGALFNALKPITDFLLNVFVGALNIVAGAIEKVAEAFGGVNAGFKKQTLELQRSLDANKRLLDQYNTDLSENVKARIDIQNDYLEKKKAILEDETLTEEKQKARLLEIDKSYSRAIQNQLNQRAKIIADNNLQIDFDAKQSSINLIQNQRVAQQKQLELDKNFESGKLENQKKLLQNQANFLNTQISQLDKNSDDYVRRAQALSNSVADVNVQITQLTETQNNIQASADIEKLKNRQQFNREDIAAVNERSLKIIDLTTQLIKEENARNVQAAKDNIARIKEQYRLEFEQARLAGLSIKKLKEQQAAELKLADEQVRKAQLQLSAFEIQQEIDKQNRLATEAGIGTQEYFDARREIAEKEFQKEVLLADGNRNLIENARTKLWSSIIEIDKEGFAQMASQVQTEYDGMYEGTVEFFDKQRQLESANYVVQQANARGNYDMLEALAKQHAKNLAMIDVAEFQAKADIEARKAATVNQITDEYFKYSREQENLQYQAQIKAAGDNLALIETINMEHAQRMRDLDAQQYEAKKQVYLAIVDLTAQFGQVLNQIGTQMMEAAQGRDKQQFENAKKMAIAGIAIEKAAAILSIIANTGIANAKAVAAFPITFGQPWVTINTISAGLSIAAIIAGAVQSISQLNSQNFEPSSGSGSSGGLGGNGMGRGYSDGGLVKGPGTSKSDSIPARLSNGEAVMTSGAVTMFGPMLSMMNQMGGGTSFAPNALTVRPDNPKTNNPAQEQSLIVKTYVVENDMTTIQQRQARLKDLSTL